MGAQGPPETPPKAPQESGSGSSGGTASLWSPLPGCVPLDLHEGLTVSLAHFCLVPRAWGQACDKLLAEPLSPVRLVLGLHVRHRLCRESVFPAPGRRLVASGDSPGWLPAPAQHRPSELLKPLHGPSYPPAGDRPLWALSPGHTLWPAPVGSSALTTRPRRYTSMPCGTAGLCPCSCFWPS